MAQFLTQVGSTLTIPGTSVTASMWLIPNPTPGGGVVYVTMPSSLSCVTSPHFFSGINQAYSIDSSGTPNSQNGTTNAIAASTTTVANNALPLMLIASTRGDELAGSNTQLNGTYVLGTGGDALMLFQATTNKTPAGSVTLNSNNAAPRSIIGQAFSLAPNGTAAWNSQASTDTPSTGTTHSYVCTIPVLSNGAMLVAVLSSGAIPTSVVWSAPFGAFFSTVPVTPTVSAILTAFAATFTVVPITVTGVGNWVNQTKTAIGSWVTQNKS